MDEGDWSSEVEFLDALNQLLPFMSPLDQQYWMNYLWEADAEKYGHYHEGLENWMPPREIDPYQYDFAHRAAMMRDVLFGEDLVPGAQEGADLGLIDPDSPVGQHIASILQLQQNYGVGSENVGNRRTRAMQMYYDTEMQRLMDWIPTGEDAVSAWNMWQPLMEELVSPTQWRAPFSERADVPTFRKGSSLYNQPGSNLGWGYQNTRWL